MHTFAVSENKQSFSSLFHPFLSSLPLFRIFATCFNFGNSSNLETVGKEKSAMEGQLHLLKETISQCHWFASKYFSSSEVKHKSPETGEQQTHLISNFGFWLATFCMYHENCSICSLYSQSTVMVNKYGSELHFNLFLSEIKMSF